MSAHRARDKRGELGLAAFVVTIVVGPCGFLVAFWLTTAALHGVGL